MPNQRPENVFKVGAVRAAIFVNFFEKAGQQIPLPKVVLEVRYKDKTGEWKSSNSLSVNEIPKAILALQKAFDYLMAPKTDQTKDTESEPAQAPAHQVPVEKI